MKYLVIDTETGGLDPKKNALLEIGVRLYDEDGKMLQAFHRKIMWDSLDNTTISVGALAVNQCNPLDGDNGSKVAFDFARWVGNMSSPKDVVLLGHNLQFDCDFISEFLERYGYVGWMEPFRHRKIDTQHIALFAQEVGLLPPHVRLSLNTLHRHFFGEDIQKHHTALADVEATFSVYREMRRLFRERVSWDGTVAIEVKK
jgi:DNA polymerase-3 subunit epsilon